MMISVHHNLEAARRLDSLTVHGLPDRIHIGGARLDNGLRPHSEAKKGGFQRKGQAGQTRPLFPVWSVRLQVNPSTQFWLTTICVFWAGAVDAKALDRELAVATIKWAATTDTEQLAISGRRRSFNTHNLVFRSQLEHRNLVASVSRRWSAHKR
jgi:hypothetical protein